jgi:hypothetical protein
MSTGNVTGDVEERGRTSMHQKKTTDSDEELEVTRCVRCNVAGHNAGRNLIP